MLLVLATLAYAPHAPGCWNPHPTVRRNAGPPRLAAASEDTPGASDLESKLLAQIKSLKAAGKNEEDILKAMELLGLDKDLLQEPPLPPEPEKATAAESSSTPPLPEPPQPERPPAPQQGSEPWGLWSNAGRDVYLELFLDAEVKAKELSVEVAEGWLLAGWDRGDDSPPPYVFGRFAQPVEATALQWAVDEIPDGRRILCIELPKTEASLRAGAGATIDCIFDESLHIHGEPWGQIPGLSSGTITIQMPSSCPTDGEDSEDAPSGE